MLTLLTARFASTVDHNYVYSATMRALTFTLPTKTAENGFFSKSHHAVAIALDSKREQRVYGYSCMHVLKT